MARDDHGPPGRARNLGANLLLLAVSLAIGLLVLELGLAFSHYRYLTQPRTDYPIGYFMADPELGADLAPNRPPTPFRMRGPAFDVFTNRWGCFDHDDPIGGGYLLAVGDSSTWGYAPLEDKWTNHLETLSGRRVLKCGVSGTGPKYQQIKARKTIAKVGIPPAVILVLYDTWNDLNDDVAFPGYGMVDGYRGQTLKSLDLRTGTLIRYTPEEFLAKYRRYLARRDAFSLTSFLTAHLTTAAMIGEVLAARPTLDTAPADGPTLEGRYDFSLWNVDPARFPWVVQAFEQHLDNLRALRQLADEQGAALVLITDGIPDQGLHARLRAFLDAEFPYHLDVAAPMAQAAQGRPLRYHHDSHWNPLGNRLAAKIIDRYLSERGLLQQPLSDSRANAPRP